MKNDHSKDDHKHPRTTRSANYSDPDPMAKDEGDLENDKWRPTPAAFESFLTRDFQLAEVNIQSAMLSTGRPVSVKELKESCLHSIDCIERVLTSKLASGVVVENRGRYELVR